MLHTKLLKVNKKCSTRTFTRAYEGSTRTCLWCCFVLCAVCCSLRTTPFAAEKTRSRYALEEKVLEKQRNDK
jgi:hypothetical protein